MKSSIFLVICFLVIANTTHSQSIQGVINDAKTEEPIEGASVYFDNTTIGVISNSNGEFAIPYDSSINTPLVVSFLGYKKQIISDLSTEVIVDIKLVEDLNSLNEVVLSSKDSWSRARKLEHFKLQFFGFSSNSRSCKIKNEDDIILRYLEDEKLLVASAKKPLIIINKDLGYKIEYDLQECEIQYVTATEGLRITTVSTVFYEGTSFYKSEKENKKIIKKRQKAFEGSALHFMRSLLLDKLEDNKFVLLYEGKVVPPENFISKYVTDDPTVYQVKIFKPLTIVYDNNVARQSTITLNKDYFYLDLNGNHSPIDALTFSGELGLQRFGDALPLDFKLK